MIYILLFGLIDLILTTILYFRLDCASWEVNPVARWLMLTFGIASVYGLKALSIVIFCAIVKALRADGTFKSLVYNIVLHIIYVAIHVYASLVAATILFYEMRNVPLSPDI